MRDERIATELEELIINGGLILYAGVYNAGEQEFSKKDEKFLKEVSKKIGDVKKAYHVWYSKAFRIVRMLAPERLEEFECFYRGQKNLKKLSYFGAGITHYLQGIVSTFGMNEQNYYGKFVSGMEAQINILNSISDNINDTLYNLESEIHYGIFKSEVNVAKKMLQHKHLRAAGAVAGVIIEGHLKKVCLDRNLKIRKKNPSISEYNDILKNEKIIDTATWRLIQRSSDIRNYCVHDKERDPKKDEVDDIIRAAEKVISDIN